MDRLLYTVPEAAKLLSVSENTVWNLLTRGELTGVKVGRARRITHDELERYVASLIGDDKQRSPKPGRAQPKDLALSYGPLSVWRQAPAVPVGRRQGHRHEDPPVPGSPGTPPSRKLGLPGA